MLAPGTRLGPYEILEPLDSGGMGEVYLGRDTRFNRDVAIKVLPDAVADDPIRRARFEREAQAIAQLSHPNICTLYDSGEERGIAFLVMEYIQGESLEQRLRLGPIRLTTALSWAIQVASALDAAHRHGIVHRDLKPANIMIAESGVKLVDFGVAKLVEGSPATGDSEPRRPTQSLTGEQRLVGTIHYMAPEQLEGRVIDARTDVFALGTTLYEMLTGRKPFDGASAASVTAAILTIEPSPVSKSGMRESIVPKALDHVVQRAMAKDPQDRWQTARDLMMELRWILEGSLHPVTRWRTPGVRWLTMTTAAAALVAIGVWAGTRGFRVPPAAPPVVFTITAPPGTRFHPGFGRFAVAPDSRKIAFVAGPADGVQRLWVQSLDSPIARQLSGTDDANGPFWSPDSASIGFYRNQATELARVNIGGGQPVTILKLSSRWLGLTPSAFWPSNNQIVYAQSGGLFRVAATGGSAAPISQLDTARDERARTMPAELPNGRFLYLSQHESSDPETHVEGRGLENAATLPVQSNAIYAGGHLLFRQGDALVAQRFDPAAVQLSGHPLTLAEDVAFNPGNGRTAFAASEDLLVYRPAAPLKLTWKDRAGMSQGSIGELGRDWNPTISPDGSRVAIDRYDPATRSFHIWMLDAQGTAAPMTHGVRERLAAWAPDAQSVTYVAVTTSDLRRVRVSGTHDEEIIYRHSSQDGHPPTVLDYTKDGRFLIFQAGITDDLWALPLQGTDRTPLRLTDTPWQESTARVSPDGHWMAFTSTEGGTRNVWVQEFPAGTRRAVSTSGGMDPSWRADGRELFYLVPDGTLMAVAVNPSAPLFGTATPLFRFNPGPIFTPLHTYSASPDGQRFLVTETSGIPDVLTAILHWTSLLK